uniref:Translation initiation factor IF-2, mitochondrial n=1 Tax=Bionectria ochroleuca TaxID=29856 RepID=A0A0B7JWD8_BIOOC
MTSRSVLVHIAAQSQAASSPLHLAKASRPCGISHGIAYTQLLSTTRTLRNTNDDGNSQAKPGFPGGFAGRPGNTFGGFGVAKKEAAGNNDRPTDAEKSRALLKNIFDSAQGRSDPRKAPPTSPTPSGAERKGDAPSLFKNVLEMAKKKTPESKDSTSWGGFSNRKSEIKVDDSRSPSTPRRKNNAENRQREAGDSNSTRLTGQAAFDAMKMGRKDNKKRPKSSPAEQDFWGELEQRVGSYQNKIKESLKETLKPVVADEWTPPKATEGQDREPRRKSRFEEDAPARRRGKKARGRGSGGRRQDDDNDDDWDDGAQERWEQRQEEKQRRKEEQKLMAQEAQEAVPVFLPEFINVSDLAQTLQQRPANFLNDLSEMGFEDMAVDTILTGETAALISMEYGFEPTVDDGATRDLRPQPTPSDPSTLPSRPPIVTIMGHVDHGKTTLLDWLRKSSVVAQEHGGITQHIGAFIVNMPSGKSITFLDTPGHAAFLTMRQRGANVTDIVVLVVAADDSVKPQTIEALKHAQAAKVPIIVAINKIDKEDARVEQVKADLSRHGVEIEDFGGDVQVVPVSGKTGQGMEDLEENIVTLSEILDVRAENDGMAEGWVLESSIKPYGRAATVLVKRGTLRQGDLIVAGRTWARIRWLRNEAGVEVSEAPPGTPVEILGWRELPDAGEQVLQAPDEDRAKVAVDYRQEMADRQQSSIYIAEQQRRQREKEAAEAAAAELAATEDPELDKKPAQPGITTQNFIVKADVAGSVEAVCGSIAGLGSHEVQSTVLQSGAGLITESDVERAGLSKAIIVNFNLPIQPHIQQLAEAAGVKILDHRVIYHVVDEVKDCLSDLLPPNIIHRVQGEADILQIFSINVKKRIQKNIAGCRVRNGAIKKTSGVKVFRKGKLIYEGTIDTLKHVKKDVMEMGKGTECGIGLDGFQDFQIDDQIQTFEVIKEKRKL